jgi:hypothetical protein
LLRMLALLIFAGADVAHASRGAISRSYLSFSKLH